MSWLTTTIGGVCLPTSQRNPTADVGSFRYIDIAGIDRDLKVISQANLIPCAEAPSRARKEVRAGDVLVSTVRPNLNAIALIPEELDCEIASTGFAVLRAAPNLIDFRYLFFLTQHREFVDYLAAHATGASYPAVSDGIVRRAPIRLPSLSEQRRIVELLNEVDQLRKLRYEADAKAARVLPALFLKTFGDPATNPKGWKMRPLLEAIGSIDSGWSAQSEPRRKEEGELGVLKVSAVTSGYFRPAEHKAVTKGLEGRTLVIPRRGDLIFSRANTRELVAATCLVEEDHSDLFLSDKLWRVTPDPKEATSLFLKTLLSNEFIRDQMRSRASGSSGSMLNVSQEAVLRLEVPLPPVDAQEPFTSIGWNILRILRSCSTAAGRLEHLWDEMLHRAFSGRLTANWRLGRMQELFVEMQQQAHLLNLPCPESFEPDL